MVSKKASADDVKKTAVQTAADETRPKAPQPKELLQSRQFPRLPRKMHLRRQKAPRLKQQKFPRQKLLQKAARTRHPPQKTP